MIVSESGGQILIHNGGSTLWCHQNTPFVFIDLTERPPVAEMIYCAFKSVQWWYKCLKFFCSKKEDFLEIEYISESLPCWHIPVMCENTTEKLETENNPRCPTSNAVFIKSWLLGFPKKKQKVQSLTLETSVVNFGPVLYTPQKPCLGIADAKWTHLTSAHDSKCTFITPKTVK